MKEHTRRPPENQAAEVSVLGSMMINNAMIAPIKAIVGPEHFCSPRHRVIFEGMCAVDGAGSPVDLVTLQAHLQARESLEAVGGVDYLMCIVEAVPAAAAGEHYALLVRKAADKRSLLLATEVAMRDLFDGGKEVEAVASELQIAITGACAPAEAELIPLRDALKTMIDEADRVIKHGETPAIKTGMSEIDNLTGGMAKGEQVILAGRPSMGKSTLALNIATNVAQSGTGALFISMEMLAVNLATNCQARYSGLNRHEIYTRAMTEENQKALADAVSFCTDMPLYIVEMSYMNVEKIRAMYHTASRKHKIGLIVIDFIQLMEMVKAENNNLRVGHTSKALMLMGRDLGVATLLLSQLKRGDSRYGSKPPQMSDLRDSGELEQNAFQVWMIDRPNMGLDEDDRASIQEKGGTGLDNYAHIHVRKNRSGPTGRVRIEWDASRMLFGRDE